MVEQLRGPFEKFVNYLQCATVVHCGPETQLISARIYIFAYLFLDYDRKMEVDVGLHRAKALRCPAS
jgi:hypothetical protein